MNSERVISLDTTTARPSAVIPTIESPANSPTMNTSSTLKPILADLLWPIIIASDRLLQLWRRLWAFASLKARLGNLDGSVVVLGPPELHGSRNIHVGRNLYIYPGLYLETRHDGLIDIGSDVVLSRGVHIVAFGAVRIGDGALIGEYTSIRDANHRFGSGVEVRQSGYAVAPINIGRNVWIGRGVSILPGVTIGDNAVVGANAVVTGDVLGGTVVAGVPARVLTGSGK